MRRLPAHPEVAGPLERLLKPAPEPYLLAAERLGVPVGQVRLVADRIIATDGGRAGGDVTAPR